MQRCFGIHVKTLNNISSAGSNFFFYILNSLCTKNDLIIYEWKWLLVFAIKNLISAILRFGQNIFQSAFHWLLWQCLPAKKVDRTPIKHRADGSGGAEQSHLKIVIRDGEKNILWPETQSESASLSAPTTDLSHRTRKCTDNYHILISSKTWVGMSNAGQDLWGKWSHHSSAVIWVLHIANCRSRTLTLSPIGMGVIVKHRTWHAKLHYNGFAR